MDWLVFSLFLSQHLLRAGYTPLHMAVGYSHVATVAALLEAGADPEVGNQGKIIIPLFPQCKDLLACLRIGSSDIS